jgi:hypothetical protein
VLEFVTLLLALQMVVGREDIWLPRRWRERELGATMTGKAIPFVIRRVRFFERHSHGRATWLFERSLFVRAIGALIFVFTIGAVVAPPFSGLDTLPALGVVLLGLAIILRDIVFVVAGCVVGTGGVVLIITLGRAAARLFTSLF